MNCKQCGTDEDRLKGFCSIECRDKFDYEEEIGELKAELKKNSNKSLKILLGEYVREAGKDGRILDRFKKHVTAQIITDLENVTQEYIDRELQGIADGEMVADDMVVIEQWEAQTPKP